MVLEGVTGLPAFKDTSNNTWSSSFYYTDWTGQRRRKKKVGFKTRREALAFEENFKSKAAGATTMTFGELYELYMEDARVRLKPTTYRNKEFVIKLKVLPFFKDLPISSITPAIIRKWQNQMLSATYTPFGKQKTAQPYTQTYLKTINNQVSAIFNFAVKYYHLPQNPVRLCGSMGKKRSDRISFWTLDEFRQFITVYKDDILYYTIFMLLFWTGMREGELLALTAADFDLEEQTVSITKSYSRLDGQDLIQKPKTSKSIRTITIPPFLCTIVQNYMNAIYGLRRQDRLFPTTKYAILNHLHTGSKKAGVKKIRVHDLRHSHASFLIDLGFSPLVIKERLGHENIETTLSTYTHLYPSQQRKLLAAMEKFGEKSIPKDDDKTTA